MNLRKLITAGVLSLGVGGSALGEVPRVEMNPPGAGYVGAHGANGTARGYSNHGKGYNGYGRGPAWGYAQSYGYKAGSGFGSEYMVPIFYYVIPDGYDWSRRGQIIVHHGVRYITVGEGVMTLLVN